MTPQSRNRPRRHKPKRKPGSKRGDEYQRVVGQVAQSIIPTAHVEVSIWTEGPDGRRDLDVAIRPNGAGTKPLIVIECKDWNKPIGIAFIDALASKRHDIDASVAMVCSNSGFTADALKKAARVGIPTLAALIKGDKRIRVIVKEQIYTPIVEYIHHSTQLHHPRLSTQAQAALVPPCHTNEWSYDGKSIEAWVTARLRDFALLPKSSRSFVARFKFRHPLEFMFRGVPVETDSIDIKAAYRVQWMTQVAQVDASHGMYDYLRKIVMFGPGPHQYHMTIDSETWGDPVPVEEVPPQYLSLIDENDQPTMQPSQMRFSMIKNVPQSHPNDAPDLDSLIASKEIEDQADGVM